MLKKFNFKSFETRSAVNAKSDTSTMFFKYRVALTATMLWVLMSAGLALSYPPQGSLLASLNFSSDAIAQETAQSQGDILFAEVFDDWRVYCTQVGVTEEQEPINQCAMEQRLDWVSEDSASSQRILTVSLSPQGEENTLSAAVITPFNILLAPGIQFRVDNQEPFGMNFRTCLEVGCIANANLGENIVNSMKKGNTLLVTMLEASGERPFQLAVSLKGFTKAHERLLEIIEEI